jgi:hypothetical protein
MPKKNTESDTDADLIRQMESKLEERRRKEKPALFAVSARYNAPHKRIHIEMSSGIWLDVPVDSIPELRRVRESDLRGIVLDDHGSRLIFDDSGIELSVLAIIARLV